MEECVILTTSLARRFEAAMRKGRAVLFSAPCGFGKTASARALLAGRAPMLDARFAYHTQEVIQAVYDSSAERRHICVRSDLPRHCQAALKP